MSIDHGQFRFCLYVIGTTTISARAIVNIREICESLVPGRYVLRVVDISRDPRVASREQIFATPTLVRELPLPVKRLLGDMSARDRVIEILELGGEEGNLA